MGFFDLAGVYFWGVFCAFLTCGVFYLAGSVIVNFFDVDRYRFVAGFVGGVCGGALMHKFDFD